MQLSLLTLLVFFFVMDPTICLTGLRGVMARQRGKFVLHKLELIDLAGLQK